MREELPVCQFVELADGLSLPFDSRTDDGLSGSDALFSGLLTTRELRRGSRNTEENGTHRVNAVE